MGGNGTAEALRLAELVAARICHDLASPILVISSAADLARMEAERGAPQSGEAVPMLIEGGDMVSGRVKLLRVLFGPPQAPLGAEDLAALARGHVGGGRAEIDTSALAPGTVFSPAAARAVLAALVLAGEALPRGGTIRLHGAAEDLAVSIAGASAAWPASLTAVVAGGSPVETALAGGSRALMGPILMLHAREAGLAPQLLMGPGVPLLRLARATA